MNTTTDEVFQNFYPENQSYCYGCGRLNTDGLHIQTRWDGEESLSVFTPRPYHIALPGYVYGGLIASLIDCHGTGTAAAASYRAEGRAMNTLPPFRFVTASLKVDFLKPTPLGIPLVIRGRVMEIKGRKVTMAMTVTADEVLCARGEVIAVRIPEDPSGS